MDCIPKFKPEKRIRKNLFKPPAYCRTVERKMALRQSSCIPVKLEVSDPSKVLLLMECLSDSNSKGLEKKINRYLQTETESQVCFLIMIMQNEAVIQVVGPDKLERRRYKVPQSALDTLDSDDEEYYTMDNLDIAFQKMVLDILGTDNCKIYVFPIHGKTQTATPVILLCLVNPKRELIYCTKLIQETFKFCLALLLNTTTSEEEQKARMECQALLDVAKKLFQHLGDLGELLREIMVEARNLVKAERCSLFLIDDERENLVAKVFDGTSNAVDVKISKNKGIAGHVFKTGEIMNITDVYNHPLFYKKFDELTGFRTRNILCFPIRDEQGRIGVAQLCNKKDGDFTVEDEDAAMAVSVYCGLAIMHTLVYKKINEAQIKTQLSNEVMMYHMKVDDDTFNKYIRCKIKHKFGDMNDFDFIPRSVDYDQTPCYTIRMFDNLQLIDKFGIKKELLLRFILYIMKGYRDTPYHNWKHAFCVTHFAYLVIKNFRMIEKKFMTYLEALALLTSCLGHDVDHRGTTNAFQLKTGSPLANLYSSEGSVMERHHLSQTVCILNTQKCNFLECLDNQSYQLCLDLIKDNILATDLANHFKIFPQLEEFYTTRYIKDSIDDKRLLFSLIMTCSDLSDQTKGFKIAKDVAQKIYEEFFKQGDLEKKMGNKPLAMMDREKASIPDLQVQFIDDVCLPAFGVLAHLFPKARRFLDVLEMTKSYWDASRIVFDKHTLEGQRSFDVLISPGFEDEIVAAMESLQAEGEGEEEGEEEGSTINEDDIYSFEQDD